MANIAVEIRLVRKKNVLAAYGKQIVGHGKPVFDMFLGHEWNLSYIRVATLAHDNLNGVAQVLRLRCCRAAAAARGGR
jgi:hypothetical protein